MQENLQPNSVINPARKLSEHLRKAKREFSGQLAVTRSLFVPMKDFSQRHRTKVVHFGLWAEEKADNLGMKDSLRVLERAAKQTYEDDVRCEEVSDAIAYLIKHTPRGETLRHFKEALDIEDPVQRYHAVRHALVRIKIVLSVSY